MYRLECKKTGIVFNGSHIICGKHMLLTKMYRSKELADIVASELNNTYKGNSFVSVEVTSG